MGLEKNAWAIAKKYGVSSLSAFGLGLIIARLVYAEIAPMLLVVDAGLMFIFFAILALALWL